MKPTVLKMDDPRLGKLDADGEREWPVQDCTGQPINREMCNRKYWTQDGVTYFVAVPPGADREDVQYRVATEKALK